MKKHLLCLLVVSLVTLLCMSAAFAAEVVIKGYGASKDEAFNDALRQAVERAVGTMVDSETLVQNAAVVKDEIYTKSQGFVESWDTISETMKNGQYEVTLRVRVNTEANSPLMSKLQQLKLIEMVLRDPRIGVIIPEYYNSRPGSGFSSVSENAVIRKLQDAGFTRILDVGQIQSLRYNSSIRSILQGDLREAASVAANYGLDYLIVGQGESQVSNNLGGQISVRGRVEAKLYKVDTARVIASNGFGARGVDVNEMSASQQAFEIAGKKLGDYVVEQIMTYARNPEKDLKLVVRGVMSLDQANSIESQLKQIRGVKRVYVRSVQGGIATLDINYTGAPGTFATALEQLGNISLKVTEITNSAVQAVLR